MRSPSPKGGGLLTFHYSLFTFHSSLRSTTPSTARREPPKLGKLTSGNPKARSPSPNGGGLFFLDSPPGRSLWKEFFSPITLSIPKRSSLPVFSPSAKRSTSFVFPSFAFAYTLIACMLVCMFVCFIIIFIITTIESRNSKDFDGKSAICKQISRRNLSISVVTI